MRLKAGERNEVCSPGEGPAYTELIDAGWSGILLLDLRVYGCWNRAVCRSAPPRIAAPP